MNKHTATEIAYKNGYEQGMKDAVAEIFSEIEKAVAYRRIGNGLLDDWLEDDISEIKKKYAPETNVGDKKEETI